ncbi:kinase-like domain-containing protein [Russula dissimulans]|nr:kinase-like domain-containing protein [Russula dissimulans]
MRRNPGADRMRLLGEVASGVEFLHSSGIVHGDLCAKTVLINSEGKALVYGFDLSELSNPISRVRWLAPEMIAPTRVPPPTEATDVWSFGSLCLEVFTGVDPYMSYPDVYVPVLLNKGTIPEHPGPMAIGLSPMMWELMQSCWKINPAERPPMTEVQSTIRRMLPYRESYATLLRVADAQMRRDNLKHAGYNLGVETSYAAEARSARVDSEEEKQLILTPPREQALERSWL